MIQGGSLIINTPSMPTKSPGNNIYDTGEFYGYQYVNCGYAFYVKGLSDLEFYFRDNFLDI